MQTPLCENYLQLPVAVHLNVSVIIIIFSMLK